LNKSPSHGLNHLVVHGAAVKRVRMRQDRRAFGAGRRRVREH